MRLRRQRRWRPTRRQRRRRGVCERRCSFFNVLMARAAVCKRLKWAQAVRGVHKYVATWRLQPRLRHCCALLLRALGSCMQSLCVKHKSAEMLRLRMRRA